DGDWRQDDKGGVRAEAVELALDGPWSAYARLLDAFETWAGPATAVQAEAAAAPNRPDARHDERSQLGKSGEEQAVRFWFSAAGLALQAPGVFGQELIFDRIETRGGLHQDPEGRLGVRFDNTHVVNQDMDLQWRGSWQEGGSGAAGLADIRGVFHRAALDGIHRYMPNTVNLEARQWLTHGLLDGQIENAAAQLSGDLENFPFGDGPGRFRIEGGFRDGVIDYAPGDGPGEGWP